jgi:hypothetical protein
MDGSKWTKLLHPTPLGIMGEKPIPPFMGIGFYFYLTMSIHYNKRYSCTPSDFTRF